MSTYNDAGYSDLLAVPQDNNKITNANSDSIFELGSIDAAKIANLTVDTITVSDTGYIKSGKTSFADSTNAGYYISSDGFYIGGAADVSKLKYTLATGAFDFIGTISSRSTATIASAINSSGNLITDVINTNFDTSTKKILKDFTFDSTDYSGAFKTGDITWNTTTGAITGGSGALFNKNGLVFATSGTPTITLDGTTGSATFSGDVTGATISGGIINVPNASTPLFSVDSAGNAIVNSLARNDYHIFTMFESVDGYDKTSSGLGSVTVSGSGINIVTGHYNTNYNTAKKRLASSIGLSWDKKTNIKVALNTSSSATCNLRIACGDISTSVKRHVGFYKSDDTFYGTCGNNTSQSTVSLGMLNSGLLELRYIPGDSIKYYVDGTYIDEITTNLPSGEVSADIIINLSATNTDATDTNTASMLLGWYDFWQAN